MTVPVTVKYGGVTVKTSGGNYTSALKYAGSAKFFIKNQRGENFDTWLTRRHQSLIEIFRTSTGELKWSGYVETVIDTDPMEVGCLGILSKLGWDVLTEDGGKMIIDSLLIKQAPTTDIQVIVDTEDEDKDPGFTDNQWGSINNQPDRYAIISDETRSEASNSYDPLRTVVAAGTTISGDETDLTDIDQVYWHVDTHDDQFTQCEIEFQLGNQGSPIADTEQLTKIKIILAGKITAQQGVFYPPSTWRVYWAKSGGVEAEGLMPNWTITTPIGGSAGTPFYFEEEIEIEEGDSDKWFTAGGVNWEDGSIFIVKPDEDLTGVFDRDIFFDKAEITVSHSSANFETVNRLIRDVDVDVGFDIIQVNNDAENADYNLTGKGITTNDGIKISIGVVEALNKINNTGIAFEINGGTDPKVGTTQNYIGVYNVVAFQQIVSQMVYTYFPFYHLDGSGNNLVDFKILSVSDIAAAVVTYDKDNDPPTWALPKSAEPNEYGFITVKYLNGAMTGKIATGSSDPRTLLVDAPFILTRAEAEEYGAAKAAYHALQHLNIPLVWNNYPTNDPQVGVKYDYTGLKWNGSALVNDVHTDEICRRISVSWRAGITLPTVKAWLGGGETDPAEKLAMWEAEIERRQRVVAGLLGTTFYGSVTRYSQLLGKPDHDALPSPNGNANEQHLTAAQVAALHATYTNANAVTAMGAKADGNPLHHDFPDGTELNHDALANPNGNAEEQHMTAAQITALHATYTNAQALAIVNATGLALANTKVITSQDADLTFTFGRAQIDSRFSDMMTISHRDMSAQDNYAFGQTSSGSTYINAPTGQLIHLHINDIMKMSLSTGSLSMAVPIAMGANKITGLANGTVATNAMAFGQKYTSADVIAALTALGFTVADTGGEFKITHKDKNSANNVTVFHDGTTYLWNNNTAPSWFAWEINSGRKADINILGLRLGGTGARISVFDTSTLVASDTKVPTNTTVKEYVDNRADNKAYPHQIFPGGGAVSWFITGTVYQNGGVFHPTSTVGAVSAWMIKIPDGATGTFNLKVHHWSTTSSTYSGTWTVSAFSPTENRTSDNILNASNAYDLTSPASRVFAVKTIPMSGVAGGDVVNIEFKSDASNGGNCIIHALHIEWT